MPTARQPRPFELAPTATESRRVGLFYHFSRLQFPSLAIPESAFRTHLTRALGVFAQKQDHGEATETATTRPTGITWQTFLDGLYLLDWTVCCGCLDGLDRAWEMLFATRTGRSDCLLVDALRARACRLYPRDDEKQETAVNEFWSHLLVSDNDSPAVLFRYDGQRPLAPWLIRVFQNWHLTKLRRHAAPISLPDDDIALPMPTAPREETRWHEAFCIAVRVWLGKLDDHDRLLLGLRWRYKTSQRDIASLLGVHEGTISRQTDKLRDRALEVIRAKLILEGWTGDDLDGFILTEMAAVLTDEPRLSADVLTAILRSKGLQAPAD